MRLTEFKNFKSSSKSKILVILMILFSAKLYAQEIIDLVEKTVSSESEEASQVTAKKEIQEEAIHKATGEILKDLIGNERFSKNLALIQNKIYRQWNIFLISKTMTLSRKIKSSR